MNVNDLLSSSQNISQGKIYDALLTHRSNREVARVMQELSSRYGGDTDGGPKMKALFRGDISEISPRARELANRGDDDKEPKGAEKPGTLIRNDAAPPPPKDGFFSLEPGAFVEGSFEGDRNGGQFHVDGLGMIGSFDANGNIQIGDFKGTVEDGNRITVRNEATGEAYMLSYETDGDSFKFYDIQEITQSR